MAAGMQVSKQTLFLLSLPVDLYSLRYYRVIYTQGLSFNCSPILALSQRCCLKTRVRLELATPLQADHPSHLQLSNTLSPIQINQNDLIPQDE